MLSRYKMDLHNHTCLSPCGDAGMIPQNILRAAVEKGIGVIGITDHNSVENVSAVKRAAEDFDISVIGGMEVTTQEEIHVLVFFDDDKGLLDFQELIYANLHGSNRPEYFGNQWVVDFEGGVLDLNPRLLIGAVTIGIREVEREAHLRGGLVIAAHADKTAFSIISQLGFIPPDVALDAVELSPFFRTDGNESWVKELPAVTFSDAHYLQEIGRAWIEAYVGAPTAAELKLALGGGKGRRFTACC